MRSRQPRPRKLLSHVILLPHWTLARQGRPPTCTNARFTRRKKPGVYCPTGLDCILAGLRLVRVLVGVSKESIIELTPGKMYHIWTWHATGPKVTKLFTTSDTSLRVTCASCKRILTAELTSHWWTRGVVYKFKTSISIDPTIILLFLLFRQLGIGLIEVLQKLLRDLNRIDSFFKASPHSRFPFFVSM